MSILSGDRKAKFIALQSLKGAPAYVPVWPTITDLNAPAPYAISSIIEILPLSNNYSTSLWVYIDPAAKQIYISQGMVPGYNRLDTGNGYILQPGGWYIYAFGVNPPENDVGSIHHIVAVSGPSGRTIYIDGIIQPMFSNSKLPIAIHSTIIGAFVDAYTFLVGTSTPMMGQIINYMHVYSALSPSDILKIYKLGPSAKPSDYAEFNPTSLWCVPESSPRNIVKDYGTRGIDLQLQNGLRYQSSSLVGTPGIKVSNFDLGIPVSELHA